MRTGWLKLGLTGLWAALLAMPALAYEAVDAQQGRPAPASETRCTADLASCISAAAFVPDTCHAIDRAARRNGLDSHFLARLIWKESLFDPAAVSPAGAQGFAQFMPGTAKIVGLRDPFNPAEAIDVSARYLADLSARFGNIGLAAVAYNGGEDRAARFIGASGGLPFETRDYVMSITGLSAEIWRDDPPKSVDLHLDKQKSFSAACIDMASKRRIKDYAKPEQVYPWGVIIASHPSRAGAQRQVELLTRKMGPVLKDKSVYYVRMRLTGMKRRNYAAQIGWERKTDAYKFCNQYRGLGGRCIVLRN